MERDRLITDIKRIGRRRVEFYKRSVRKELVPLRITRRQLKTKKAEYDTIIASHIRQMEEYRTSPEFIPLETNCGTELFEDFNILSYNGDKMGKVLGRDGHIYRGVYKESVPVFKKLWNSGLLQILGKNGYIPVTSVTEFYCNEYPIILEHSVVDMSTSKSWNRLMIKDACIVMSIINRVASAAGFTLHDGHLNNMTFHNGRPMFTDIGSIVEDEGQKTGYTAEIVFAGLYRLIFAGLGNTILRRIQIYDEDNNALWITPKYYDDATFEYYKALKVFKRYHLLHSSPLCNWIIFRMFDCYDERPEFIELIFGKVAGLVADNEQAVADIEPVTTALEILQLDITSVVDIGGTSGGLSLKLRDRLKVKCLSIDYDEARSVKTYERFKKAEVPINTMIFHYLYGADDNTREYVRSDLAIALDITHNLQAYQKWKADSLVNALSKMAEKYVVVTFYPDEVCDIEGFVRYFKVFFEIVYKNEVTSVNGNADGVILVGKKCDSL